MTFFPFDQDNSGTHTHTHARAMEPDIAHGAVCSKTTLAAVREKMEFSSHAGVWGAWLS